jgi:hypothetical protein
MDQLRLLHQPDDRAPKDHKTMKEHSGLDHDCILMEDWCDIDPRDYVPKGIVNRHQCYNLNGLIAAMDAGLRETGQIRDPMTNLEMHDEIVIAVCAHYLYNGKDLPGRLGQHALELMLSLPDARERAQRATRVRPSRLVRWYQVSRWYLWERRRLERKLREGERLLMREEMVVWRREQAAMARGRMAMARERVRWL